MAFNLPIEIQKIDETTESWSHLYNLHAEINKSNGSEYLNTGAERSKATLVFKVRYFKSLEDIFLNTQLYRIVYRGNIYNIEDYDDFKEQHKTIRLLGVASQ